MAEQVKTDGLELILNAFDLEAESVRQPESPALPRAPRFRVPVPVRYRLPADHQWTAAVTEDISQTGVLFSTTRSDYDMADSLFEPSPDGVRIDLIFEVPDRRGLPIEVASSGTLVRVLGAAGGSHLAVAVNGYRREHD